jgi:hypothetical protein
MCGSVPPLPHTSSWYAYLSTSYIFALQHFNMLSEHFRTGDMCSWSGVDKHYVDKYYLLFPVTALSET